MLLPFTLLLRQWFPNCDMCQNHLESQERTLGHRVIDMGQGPVLCIWPSSLRNLNDYQNLRTMVVKFLFKRNLELLMGGFLNGALGLYTQTRTQLFCFDQRSCHRQIPPSCCHLIFYSASPAELINYRLFSDMVAIIFALLMPLWVDVISYPLLPSPSTFIIPKAWAFQCRKRHCCKLGPSRASGATRNSHSSLGWKSERCTCLKILVHNICRTPTK